MARQIPGILPIDFFEISNRVMPKLPELPRTEDMACEVAYVIQEKRFLIKYDKTTAPIIRAAALRNPDLTEETLRKSLSKIKENEYIIIYDSGYHPPVLGALMGDEADYVNTLSYDELVESAESMLNDLLRFCSFDYKLYMLYLGAAFAITKAEHPDWIYETFIECFRKDVVKVMAYRSRNYLGYKDFVNGKSGR